MLNKYIIHYLFVGSRGGATRMQIIKLLQKNPLNMNMVSKNLKLDYKTIQHHLRILEENNVISAIKKGSYGALYHLSIDAEESKDFKELVKNWK